MRPSGYSLQVIFPEVDVHGAVDIRRLAPELARSETHAVEVTSLDHAGRAEVWVHLRPIVRVYRPDAAAHVTRLTGVSTGMAITGPHAVARHETGRPRRGTAIARGHERLGSHLLGAHHPLSDGPGDGR